eukprot:6468349-Amphidinium_carterae.1
MLTSSLSAPVMVLMLFSGSVPVKLFMPTWTKNTLANTPLSPSGSVPVKELKKLTLSMNLMPSGSAPVKWFSLNTKKPTAFNSLMRTGRVPVKRFSDTANASTGAMTLITSGRAPAKLLFSSRHVFSATMAPMPLAGSVRVDC